MSRLVAWHSGRGLPMALERARREQAEALHAPAMLCTPIVWRPLVGNLAPTLVSRDDVARIVRKFAGTGGMQAVRRSVDSLVDSQQRVVDHWSEPGVERQWFDVPAVQRRWAKLVSGDADVDFRRHVAARYFADGVPRRALSMGCGFGHRELAWSQLDVFDELIGVDLAPPAVAAANDSARAAGISPAQLRFEVGDTSSLQRAQQEYDVIIFEHSLHHFTDVAGTLQQVERLLRPGGLLLLDEYVGPTKFQWTTRQIEAADSLLKVLPVAYRRRSDGRTKSSVRRPSLLAMRVDDPSEAIEAAEILPAVRAGFQIEEERGYGGAVLHPLLSGIAQHFIEPDEQAKALLEMCFTAEDALLEAREVEHDFAVVVARKP